MITVENIKKCVETFRDNFARTESPEENCTVFIEIPQGLFIRQWDNTFLCQHSLREFLAVPLSIIDNDFAEKQWFLKIMERLTLHDQTAYIRDLFENITDKPVYVREQFSRVPTDINEKDICILDFWLAGMSEKFGQIIGHPGIPINAHFSNEFRKYARAYHKTHTLPEKSLEEKIGFAREALNILRFFPDAELDRDAEGKFITWHGLEIVQNKANDAPIEIRVSVSIYPDQDMLDNYSFGSLSKIIPLVTTNTASFNADLEKELKRFRPEQKSCPEQEKETASSGMTMR